MSVNDNIRINKRCTASEMSDRILGILEIKDGVKCYNYNGGFESFEATKTITNILINKLSNNEFNVIMEIINNSDKNKGKK